jgi:tRNA nucleotidyltransferase (CCA-adding enzyme)
MLEEEIVIKYYLVGGAVRDMVMGVTCNDYDFVVVGASPSDFSDWKFVGKDFPVFLEPTHGWEVALSRTERKIGVGYTGFETEWNGVTLGQDLSRRDLTINAMAIEVDFAASVLAGKPITVGGVIDPYGGVSDIKVKVLHHTSEAFIEDSVRVLRVARFLAKFDKYWVDGSNHWKCSPDLYKLLEYIDVNDLTPERVWLEMSKSFSEDNPSAFFDNMSDWNSLFPLWEDMWKTPQKKIIIQRVVSAFIQVWLWITQQKLGMTLRLYSLHYVTTLVNLFAGRNTVMLMGMKLKDYL